MNMNDALASALVSSITQEMTSGGRHHISVEGVVHRLQEAFNRSTQNCQFRPGDIVTPRKDSTYRGHGLPSIVMEVMAPNTFAEGQAEGDTRCDMRVLVYSPKTDSLVPHWVESFMYEPWVENMGNPPDDE